MRKKILNKTKKILAVLLITTMMSSVTVYGSTKATTPMKGWRYAKKTASYQVNSTSKKYKNTWSKATKKWIDSGFKWTKKGSSKTTVASYEDNSKSGLKIAGYCNTTYRASDGVIVKNKIRLNRAVFKKYDYTEAQIINVAEHELGHALGLAHNNQGSVSVMNPANRYYSIQKCDIKGMEKRYSTAINNAVVRGDEIITVTEYFLADIPVIKNVGVKYDTKKIFITGKAKGCKYVTGKYNGKEKTVKVESNKFKLVFDYTKAKDIKISGLNSKKERISRNKKVKVEKYVTEKPIYDKIKRTGEGIKYGVKTVANSTLSFKYKGKLIKKCVIDSSYTNITIKDSILKGKSGYFTVTQKENGKKISKKMKFPILKKGEASEISYYQSGTGY